MDSSQQPKESGAAEKHRGGFPAHLNFPSYKHRAYWYGKTHTDFTENRGRDCANVISVLGFYSPVISSPLEEGKSGICLYVYYI